MPASSSTLLLQFTPESEDVIMTDAPMQLSVPTVEITSTVPSKGKRVITKEDWEWLQPIVSRLYIQENLTFLKIEAKLRSDYDFYLSRRTFTKKIDNWGLKKNLRKTERSELLKLGVKHRKFRGDHRLKDEARLKRLQKRYCGCSPEDTEIDRDEDTTGAMQSRQLPQKDLPNILNPDDQTHFGDDGVEEIMPQFNEMDTSHQWSAATTVSIDELVVALGNLGFPDARQLLTPYRNPAGLEESDSDTDPQQPLGPPRAGASDTESYSNQKQLVQHRVASRTIQNRKIGTLTFSPYSEISIFPTQSKKASRITWDTYVVKVNKEWPMKWERLQAQLQSPSLCNTDRISTLDHLASLEDSMFADNSSTYEELLTVLKSETKCDRRRITKTYFQLIERYIRWTKFPKVAKHFHEYLNELKSDETNDFAKLELLYLQAFYLYRLGHYNKAENIMRRAIWCALTHLGPYHEFTVSSLNIYCSIAENLKPRDFVAGENIRRFYLSIYSGQVTDFNFILWYDNTISLLWHFTRNGRYEEGQSLCTYITKRVKLAFGTGSVLYTECQIEQAKIWRAQGKLSEALDLLYSLSGSPGIGEKTRRDIFEYIGQFQWDKNDFPEAAIWFWKSFESTVMLSGLQHPNVLITCKALGICFEVLGQWGAALRLYSKFAERLRGCRGIDPSSVKKVEGWILYVEGTIERIAQRKKSERDENANGGVKIEVVENMEWEQIQDRTDLDVDWDALKDIPTPEWYSE
ncbi:Clr5 domain-containing protein [Rutstroemia sp. NJR-2017a WRK4]|nr:Clr5 domain-containing protein [Rutstroemia sp. NJR-2017a WRK4]